MADFIVVIIVLSSSSPTAAERTQNRVPVFSNVRKVFSLGDFSLLNCNLRPLEDAELHLHEQA